MIVGIDPGLSGGIATLNNDGSIVALGKLRFKEHKGRKELDANWLADFINLLPLDSMVVVESCGYHYKMSKTMRSCALSYGIIVGVCDTMGIDLHRVEPKTWQRAMLGKVPRGKTKQYAFDMACNLWPDQTFLATKRSKVAHDGLIDAALIAQYGVSYI